jgi:predicted phosphodiesterase
MTLPAIARLGYSDSMKFALLSDLHANRQALEAVWEHLQLQQVDRLVFLGDYVDYGADPAWTLDFVMREVAQGAIAVKGNHDDAMATQDGHQFSAHVQASLDWTVKQLSDAHKAFLAELPLTVKLDHCLFTHANAHAPASWAYVHDRLQAARSLNATTASLVFCGHMHEPCLYHQSRNGKMGEFTPVNGVATELSPSRHWLVIPGSVGQPRDGNPAACYAIFDTAQHLFTLHRVPYDHDSAAASILAAGLPDMNATRLAHGI